MIKANVKLTGPLEEFIRREVGEYGHYETVSEYIRDLIRHDMEAKYKKYKKQLYEHLKPALQLDESEYIEISPEDLLKKIKERHADKL